MKEFGSILFLIAIFSAGEFYKTSPWLNTVFSDSSNVNSAPFVQTDSLAGGRAQNPDINNQNNKLYSDCNALPPDSTYPGMKIFVPDTSLTASMPVLKPGLVDPGIFAPGSNCKPEYRN